MAKKQPRYRDVVDELTRGIQSGKYAAGQKLPSEAALVKRFQTSRITIGRALRELKTRGLISGVAGSGNFVRPAPKSNEGLVFGLLIPDLGETEIFEPICRGMAAAPESESHALLWGHTSGEQGGTEQQALDLCRQFISRQVDGVFFAPLELTEHQNEVNTEICALLDKASIPVVLLDRCILRFPDRSKYDLVGIDNRRAGYLAAEHLLSRKCGDVGFLSLAGAAATVEARIAGYREALMRQEVTVDEKWIRRLGSVSVVALKEAIESAGVSAFVCANDRLAGQLMQAAHELRMRIPEDLRVVGIDDVEYAKLLPVPLTTVHQPCRAIGEAAMSAMLARRQRPEGAARDILLECRLVIRKSSGA